MVAALVGRTTGHGQPLTGLGRLGVDVIPRFHLRLLTVGPAGATPQGGLSWRLWAGGLGSGAAMIRTRCSLKDSITILIAIGCGVGLALTLQTARLNAKEQRRAKIFAQQLVETAVARHPELSGVELSVTPPGGQNCVTIASTETKDLGEKCDEDEFTAMRTGKPFAEKEKDGFDIAVPLHDITGKLIGTVGMDFKPKPGQQEPGVIEQSTRITRELEKQIPSKAALFEPVG